MGRLIDIALSGFVVLLIVLGGYQLIVWAL